MISVEDRLPEKDETYLITLKSKYLKEPFVVPCQWHKELVPDTGTGFATNEKVLAWMSLPKPYRAI